MSAPSGFLRDVRDGLLKAGGKALGVLISAAVPAATVLLEVAGYVMQAAKEREKEAQLKADLQALVQASAEEMRRWVAEVVVEAGGIPPAARQALTSYLTQLPASIRQSLKRPADASGRTVPAWLQLRKAEDLLTLLPQRLPRFQPGSRPISGVDLELIELLGMGGFGEVWKARNPLQASAEPVALKFCIDPQSARLLRHEAVVLDRVLQQGHHPNFVQLLRTSPLNMIIC